MHIKNFFLLLIFIFHCLTLLNVNAQTVKDIGLAANENTEDDPNICFKDGNYNFGSVKIKIISETESTVNGGTITFNTELENNNTYPITGGKLYVKIYEYRDFETTPNDANGDDLIDQFVALEKVVMDGKETKKYNFTWEVPVNIKNGKYKIVGYFISHNKFNLAGLSFTDDIIGSSTDFKVVSDFKDKIYLEKTSVLVNNEKYKFMAYPPRFTGKEGIKVEASINNPTNKNKNVKLVTDLYVWDNQDNKNLINSTEKSYILQPNSKIKTNLLIADTDYPVYYVVLTLYDGNAKSILNIRVVREDVEKLRINFPSITSYPIKENVLNKVFTCVHNANDFDVNSGKIVLEIKDKKGDKIHSQEYNGVITSDMMGIESSFISKESFVDFDLYAYLYNKNNILLEEVKIEYNCADINMDKYCPKNLDEKSPSNNQEPNNNPTNILFYTVLMMSIILLILLIINIKKFIKQ